MVIDLHAEAVHAVSGRCLQHQIACGGRGEVTEHGFASGRCCQAGCANSVPRALDVCRRNNGSVAHGFRLIALAFIIQKEEGLILQDRAAYGSAELLVTDRGRNAWVRISTATGVFREIVNGISEVSMPHPLCRAMPIVGTALHHHVNGSATLYPKLG